MPGNLFLLILKNKMAATGVNKMAAVDFFSTLSKGLMAQKVLQLQFFHEICCSATLSLFSDILTSLTIIHAGYSGCKIYRSFTPDFRVILLE